MHRNDEAWVAVTGIGMITPLGLDTQATWNALLEGRSGIRPITKFDAANCKTRIGGELPAGYPDLEKKHTPKRIRKMTVRATRMMRICANEAIADSALEPDAVAKQRVAVVVGTSGSSVRSPEDQESKQTARYRIIREMINAMPAWISLDHGFRGPTFTVSAGSCSGAVAIQQAYDMIRSGIVEVAIVGGVDYLLTENNVMQWNGMGLLTERNDKPQEAVRPFDRSRDGYALADGGCAVVLESRATALARGATVYAWLAGSATMSGAQSRHGVDPEAIVSTLEHALTCSGFPKTAVGYISANGCATIAEDRRETQALKTVFGEHAYRLLVSSQKSMLGHTIGAAGAIEFAATALALESGKIPPTINYEQPDPQCDLNYVPNSMIETGSLEVALSLTFARSGHSNAIVLARNS